MKKSDIDRQPPLLKRQIAQTGASFILDLTNEPEKPSYKEIVEKLMSHEKRIRELEKQFLLLQDDFQNQLVGGDDPGIDSEEEYTGQFPAHWKKPKN